MILAVAKQDEMKNGYDRVGNVLCAKKAPSCMEDHIKKAPSCMEDHIKRHSECA